MKRELGAKIVDDLRLAPAQPEIWKTIFEDLSDYFEGVGAFLFANNSAFTSERMYHSASLNGALELYFRENWHLNDSRRSLIPHAVKNGWATDRNQIDHPAKQQDKFYSNFLPRTNLGEVIAIDLGLPDDGYSLCIQRKSGTEGLPEETSDRVAMVRAPLMRAARATHDTEMRDIKTAIGLLANNKRDLFILDSCGKRADSFFPDEILSCSTLSWRKGRLRHIDFSIDHRLEKLIDAVVKSPRCDIDPAPITFRHGEMEAIHVDCIPLRTHNRYFSSQFVAVLSICTVTDDGEDLKLWMRENLKLSYSEISLCKAMVKGVQTSSFAQIQGVSDNAVRQKLKSIYRKTGTRKQAELVSFLANAGL